jgi:outer membrane protein assembly factor BamA
MLKVETHENHQVLRSFAGMGRFIAPFFCTALFLFHNSMIFAQWEFCLDEKTDSCLVFQERAQRDSCAQEWHQQALLNGHLASFIQEVDSAHWKSYLSEKQEFNSITNLDSLLILGGFDRREGRSLKENSLSYEVVAEIAERFLQIQENRGYPFARCAFEPEMSSDGISLKLKVNRGPRVSIDSLILKSKTGIRAALVEKLLLIKKGDPYNEQQLLSIPERINKIPYLKNTQAPQITFSEKGAKVYLFVEKNAANRFDGMIGFQPDPSTDGTIITGDINLDLQNTLQQGERLQFQWRRLQSEVQELDIGIQFPYLLQTSLGLRGEIEIYRRDSTFSTTRLRGEVVLLGGFEKEIGGFVERWNSNQLGSTLGIEDISITRYGLRSKFIELDHRLNPLNGIELEMEGSAGIKTRKTFDEFQEAQSIESTQIASKIELKWHKGIIGNLGIGGRIIGEKKWDESLLTNEFFRIGGLNSLRGFNEEGIFTPAYAIASLHLKYRLDTNSGAFVFFDQGWTDGDEFNPDDRPYGFGAGVNFGTKNGVFSLVYALGSQFNQAILLREAKIHFGFVNLF